MKNGEGTFYHMHTGQIQKGMWLDDVCVTSVMEDVHRQRCDRPTPYPIPKVYIYIFYMYTSNIPNHL